MNLLERYWSDNMLYILIGIFGFVSLLLFDILSLKNQVFLKYFFAFFGIALIVYASISLGDYNGVIFISSFVRGFSLLLAIIFMALLIYSVFFEVGGNTYQKIAEPKLVTDGTYSLVRHPGVIWLFLLFLFLGLYNQNTYILLTAFIWTLVNTLYVIIQEKLILQKLFPNYKEYVKTTPMVIPNYYSLKKFITIQNWRK